MYGFRFFLSSIFAVMLVAGCEDSQKCSDCEKGVTGDGPQLKTVPPNDLGISEELMASLDVPVKTEIAESSISQLSEEAPQSGTGVPVPQAALDLTSIQVKYPTKWSVALRDTCKYVDVPEGAENVVYYEPKVSGFKSSLEIITAYLESWRTSSPAMKVNTGIIYATERKNSVSRKRVFVKTPSTRGFYWRLQSQNEGVQTQVNSFITNICEVFVRSLAVPANTTADFAWSYMPLGVCRYDFSGQRVFSGVGDLSCNFGEFSSNDAPNAPHP